MFKISFSILLSLILILSQPLLVLAQVVYYDPVETPSAGGMGFFRVPANSDTAKEEAYLLRGSSGQLWAAKDTIWLTHYDDAPMIQEQYEGLEGQVLRGVNLKVLFPGANPDVTILTEQPMPGKVSFIKGETSKDWVTGIPLWGVVRYRNLYPGVDLVIRSSTTGFDWHYEVKEGFDPGDLKIWIQGADGIKQYEFGTILETSVGDMRLPTLGVVAPEDIAITQKKDRQLSSELLEIYPRVDPPEPTALDSLDGLSYSTYLGGSDYEFASDIAIDSIGDIYVAGVTRSSDFPTTPGIFDSVYDSMDGYVAKFDMGGESPVLAYAAYIGGSGLERAHSLAVENEIAYVTGETNSLDFPLAGASADVDAFVIAVNPDGTGLIYSELIGGSDPAGDADDKGFGIDVENGSTYITGITYSSNFPVTNDTSYGRIGDVFVAKLDPSGVLSYATYKGGKDTDMGASIQVRNGIAWVTGETYSSDFGGGFAGASDLFLIKVSSLGLVTSTRTFGGIGGEVGLCLVLDDAGDVYITGSTDSIDFPVTDGSTYGGGYIDAFLVKMDQESIIYATYLGGSASDQGNGIAIDAGGGVVLTGFTWSPNFPVTDDAYQSALGGSGDAFVTRYFLLGDDPDFISYSTYLGGSKDENAKSIVVDGTVFAYIFGQTKSSDFPITSDGLFQTLNGSQDSFISILPVGPLPAIQIEKSTNGLDADEAPGEYYLPGTPITWTYTIINTGESSLTNVEVTDSKGVNVSCPKTVLSGGESMLCTAPQATAEPDQYSNLGTVTAVDPVYGTLISDVDASHYFGVVPDTTLLKLTNDQDVDLVGEIYLEPGDNVIWEYVVENTGNVELTGIVVTDDKLGEITCPKTTLAAGESMTCTATGTAEAGQYENTGTVVGVPPVGPNVEASDLSHYFGSAPDIDIEKSTNGEDADTAPGAYVKVGDPVNWEYIVANTGNVDLTNVIVTDDMEGTVDCPQTDLASGESMTCSASGTAAAGQYANLGSVIGTPPVGSNVTDSDPSHYFGSEPEVTLEYSVNGNPADTSPGLIVQLPATLDLVYEVTNTGTVPLYDLVVTDGTFSCQIEELAVDALDTSCTRQITALSGQQSATASITANPPEPLAPENDSDPMYYFGATPGLSLDKKTEGQQADETPGVYVLTGSTVNWTYDVENTGNVNLTNVSVVDDMGVNVNCPANALAVGESMTCTASDTAQEGQYTNTGTVTGSPTGGLSPIQDSDTSHYFGTTLSVSLEKATNGDDADTEPGPYIAFGDTVNWTYTITNNSNVEVSFTISDIPTATISCPKTTLAISESTICTANDTADAGQYENTATVTVTPPGLETFNIQDTSHYFGVTTGIDIQKRTNGQDADEPTGPLIKVGTAINWTYEITNLSNIPINSIVVTDSDDSLEITCPSTELGAGAFMTCTASGTAVEGQYSNIGTVNAATIPAGFGPLSDTDPSHYFGSNAGVEINKLTNDVDIDDDPVPYILVGDPVSWKYVITNVGNLQVNNILVTDSDTGLEISCPGTTLEPSTSMTCTAQGTAVAGEYTNTGYVEAIPAGFTEKVQNSDDSAYIGANPSITIEKSTNGFDADEGTGPYIPVGESLTFQYEVSNTETDYQFKDIQVMDDAGVAVNCPSTKLDPGDEPMICTAESAAALGQQNFFGHVSAKAILVSIDETLGEVEDSDPSHYFGYTPPGLTLKKYTNGNFAEEPPGPELSIGSSVTWTYEVTNKSNAPVSNLSVIDDDPAVTVSCAQTDLEGNKTITCSASGEVIEGQYQNNAQASGLFIPTEENITSSWTTSYYFGTTGSKIFIPLLLR